MYILQIGNSNCISTYSHVRIMLYSGFYLQGPNIYKICEVSVGKQILILNLF